MNYEEQFQRTYLWLIGHCIYIAIFKCKQIIFDQTEFCMSDGALMAISEGKKQIIKPDWKTVFEPEVMQESVMKITGH